MTEEKQTSEKTQEEKRPDLTGRKAKCSYGDKIVDSKWSLPFFNYRPGKEFDEYYCGCWGWE